jgi:thioredoxin reductase
MDAYDVVVIGGSAAGLSAALVLSRARRSVLVIDAGAPRNAPAPHMHGFLSRDGIPPKDLLEAGRREVKSYGGETMSGCAVDVVPQGKSGFTILLADGGPVMARRLLMTTGLRDELPDIPGLRSRWAHDVLHCPYCHGYEVRDQPLGVIGGSAEAVRYAQIIRQWSDDVVLFMPADALSADQRNQLAARDIGIVEGTVRGLRIEDDHLTGVEVDEGRIVPRRALFVPPRFVPNNKLLIRIGCGTDDNGWPTSDTNGQTDVPGVWVAGNVSNPRAQVITAAGEGSATAININADLVEEDVRNAVLTFNPGS